jgi:hypothetical protein
MGPRQDGPGDEGFQSAYQPSSPAPPERRGRHAGTHGRLQRIPARADDGKVNASRRRRRPFLEPGQRRRGPGRGPTACRRRRWCQRRCGPSGAGKRPPGQPKKPDPAMLSARRDTLAPWVIRVKMTVARAATGQGLRHPMTHTRRTSFRRPRAATGTHRKPVPPRTPGPAPVRPRPRGRPGMTVSRAARSARAAGRETGRRARSARAPRVTAVVPGRRPRQTPPGGVARGACWVRVAGGTHRPGRAWAPAAGGTPASFRPRRPGRPGRTWRRNRCRAARRWPAGSHHGLISAGCGPRVRGPERAR